MYNHVLFKFLIIKKKISSMICAAEADFVSCMHLSNCMIEQSNCTQKTSGSFAISTFFKPGA